MEDLNCNFYYEPKPNIRVVSDNRRSIIESINGVIDKDDSNVIFDIKFPDGSGKYLVVDYSDVPDEYIVKYTIMSIYLKGFDSGIRTMKESIKDFLDTK